MVEPKSESFPRDIVDRGTKWTQGADKRPDYVAKDGSYSKKGFQDKFGVLLKLENDAQSLERSWRSKVAERDEEAGKFWDFYRKALKDVQNRMPDGDEDEANLDFGVNPKRGRKGKRPPKGS